MRIAVVGAGGRMGTWFINYFASRGFPVLAYDINKKSLDFSSPSVKIARDLASAVGSVDFVLTCVPVRLTPGMIRQCARHMKSGATLGEISSIKQNAYSALLKIRKDIRPLCIHPMFGPGAKDPSHLKMLVVPVRNRNEELRYATEVFPDARVIAISSAREHDEAIGFVLGLTYFVNLIIAHCMSGKDLKLVKEIAGTTFKLQSILAESILTDDPELVASLISDNPYALRHIRQYLKQAQATVQLASKNRDKLVRETKRIIARTRNRGDLQESYRRLYKMVSSMDG